MQFSPGVLQGSMGLIDILSRRQLTVPELQASFPTLEGLPTAHAIEVAFFLRWLIVNIDGFAVATPEGERIRKANGYEHRLRLAILDYIDASSPPWVQTASFGRKRLLAFAGSQVGQVFLEAGLIDGTSNEVVQFWDALAARARGQKNDRLNAIGREGERLSMKYEQQRTGRLPKWVAIDNNDDGYDILSFVSAEDPRRKSIEVKASTQGLRGSFHITRNEWERALDNAQHAFHLWAVTADEKCLAVLEHDDLSPHVPENHGVGTWGVAEIPFAAFESKFHSCGRLVV